MTAPVFVDANVLVYARDERAPPKQVCAKAWLEHLWRERLGRTSMQVVSEYCVTLRRLGGAGSAAEEIWESATRYFGWKPLPVNEPLLRRAREIEQRHRLGWWDSMVVGAARSRYRPRGRPKR